MCLVGPGWSVPARPSACTGGPRGRWRGRLLPCGGSAWPGRPAGRFGGGRRQLRVRGSGRRPFLVCQEAVGPWTPGAGGPASLALLRSLRAPCRRGRPQQAEGIEIPGLGPLSLLFFPLGAGAWHRGRKAAQVRIRGPAGSGHDPRCRRGLGVPLGTRTEARLGRWTVEGREGGGGPQPDPHGSDVPGPPGSCNVGRVAFPVIAGRGSFSALLGPPVAGGLSGSVTRPQPVPAGACSPSGRGQLAGSA